MFPSGPPRPQEVLNEIKVKTTTKPDKTQRGNEGSHFREGKKLTVDHLDEAPLASQTLRQLVARGHHVSCRCSRRLALIALGSAARRGSAG